MSTIYIATHGALVPRTKVRLPAGVTIHYYSRPGELTQAMTFLYALAGGRMKPVRSVTGPCEVDQIMMTRITEHEHVWGKELAAIGGVELSCAGYDGAPQSLCTKPVGPLNWSPCPPDAHTCEGYLARYPQATEIHLSACQPYVNLRNGLALLSRWALRNHPQNGRLRQLATTYAPMPPSTPATLAVGEQEVVYREEGPDPFEVDTEVGRFQRMAAVDPHAAWQRFLAYPHATKILLGSRAAFRSTLEEVQKTVTQPQGQGWLRLDRLAAARHMDAEELLHAVRMASAPVLLAPSPATFVYAHLALGRPAEADWKYAGEHAQDSGTWLGIFRDWLRTPAGQDASGIEAAVAVDLVNWYRVNETQAFFGTAKHYEVFRSLLDLSDGMRDAGHPLTRLFPQHATDLEAALAAYVELEQSLPCEVGFQHELAREVPVHAGADLFSPQGGPTLYRLMSRLEDRRDEIDEQLAQAYAQLEVLHAGGHSDVEQVTGLDAVQETVGHLEREQSFLVADIETAEEVETAIGRMSEAYDTALEVTADVCKRTEQILEAAYAQFRSVTFTEGDLV
ncbi:hypothetical protein [Streptomyces sp. NPDC001594]|uniref:hypothetical protein n=1 Tax=Streptomyces sp. NPDC001594 TaxID=3364590 RepID=UPI0036B4E5B5